MITSKRQTKKPKKVVFAQDIPPYRHEMLVCVNATSGDVRKWLKRFGNRSIGADYLEWLEDNKNLFTEVSNGDQLGYAIANLDKKYLILVLRKFEDTWAYWECLIHELSHILDWLCGWKMLNGETEARAYLHEWLFREIRRKLQRK